MHILACVQYFGVLMMGTALIRLLRYNRTFFQHFCVLCAYLVVQSRVCLVKSVVAWGIHYIYNEATTSTFI